MLPDRSEIVIVGGGVVGASIAYHLAARGRIDVTVIERLSLTNGSTWHAAGLVGQLRSHANLTRLMQMSVETYRGLEAATGYATGWHEVGGLRVASSPQRWEELQRVHTRARGYGFDISLVSPAEAAELFPIIDLDGVCGATWTPSDGYIDPSQLTHAFATGARAAGVRIVQNCRVTGFEREGRRITAVLTELGRIECESVVNATGMWGAETASMAGVDVAVNAVEHQYVVTDQIPDLPADLPTFRDPDGRIYLKPEGGALVLGGWEMGTRACWTTVPKNWGAELFTPDEDRFTPLAEAAINRIPVFGEVGIATWINGPIPFSPDAEPIMGLTEDLDNFFHCCGFSAGIAAAGGAGQAMANWIVDGDPGMDLWPFDVRRFGATHNVPNVMARLAEQSYGHYYDIAHPWGGGPEPRGRRRSMLHNILDSKGAVFGSTAGIERPMWFRTDGGPRTESRSFGRSEAWPFVVAEVTAAHTGVVVADQSARSVFELSGPGALALLSRVSSTNPNVAVDESFSTALLNGRGGIEALVRVVRLAIDRFWVVTSAALARHDATFLLQHASADVVVRDLGPAVAALTVAGPQSRAAVDGVLAWVPAVVMEGTLAGEPSTDIIVPSDYLPDAYERVVAAGAVDVGSRAIDSLRLESCSPVWSRDVHSDDTPDEIGIELDVTRPGLVAGPALLARRTAGDGGRLTWFSVDSPELMHDSGLVEHAPSGITVTVRGGGFAHGLGRSVFSTMLPAGVDVDSGGFSVRIVGAAYPAEVLKA